MEIKAPETTNADILAPFERITIPQGIYNKLSAVDFKIRDALAGSFGSRKQFEDNLSRNYYYVPAKYLDEEKVSALRYIALFQSKSMFGGNGRIEYYGEITVAKHLCRREIRFPMRRDNGDEMYYAFAVSEWKRLSPPISATFEIVNEPKLTSFFLLQNSTQTYELFGIGSAQQYILLHELRRMYSEAQNASSEHFEALCGLNNGKALRINGKYIEVIDENGNSLIAPPITLSDFARDPRRCFATISAMSGIQ